ncbi:hypothetical protein niasHS_012939 [Heterodera schachtii]|uniref:TIL domain-containing protein n=1 Tax=Heterodera schachtii TaxID=97005 RepID=A0ABD2IFX6_HETSC
MPNDGTMPNELDSVEMNNNVTTAAGTFPTEASFSTATNKFSNGSSENIKQTSRAPFSCENGEEMRICAFCERTCRHPFQFCGMANCFLPPKCYCKIGHVRDKRGKCIPTEKCPNECCVGPKCVECHDGFGCVARDGLPKCVLDSQIVCNIRCLEESKCIVRNGRPICERK